MRCRCVGQVLNAFLIMLIVGSICEAPPTVRIGAGGEACQAMSLISLTENHALLLCMRCRRGPGFPQTPQTEILYRPRS